LRGLRPPYNPSMNNVLLRHALSPVLINFSLPCNNICPKVSAMRTLILAIGPFVARSLAGPLYITRRPALVALRIPFPASSFPARCYGSSRSFATHKDRTTTNSSADINANKTRSAFDGRESVGPFPLGIGPNGRRQTWAPWARLSRIGKGM
jgi:hypothetical protein